MSSISFFAYARDKSSAKNSGWRTPETTLHLLDLFCGWPGALLAQNTYRHKTKKLAFQIVFWLSVVFNLFGLVTMCTQKFF